MASRPSRTCSSDATRSRSPRTHGRWRRSPFTPGATGRWRRRCGTWPARRSASPWPRLLGGVRDRVPAYASLGELRAPEQRAEDAHALVAAGFRAVKVRIARDRIAEGIAVVAAMRDAVDDALEIMVDLNQWWRMAGDIDPGPGPRRARGGSSTPWRARRAWVEEPLAGDDLAGMRMLRETTGVRIAGGEMARDFDDLRRALDADALDVLQPDVVLALGVSRRADARRPGAAAQPLVHPAHVDQRDRAAGQPARLLRRRRRPVPRVSPTTRRAGRRSGATSCSPQPMEIDADGLLPCRDAPGLGIKLDEERSPLRGAVGDRPDHAHRGVHRRALRARRRRTDVRTRHPA